MSQDVPAKLSPEQLDKALALQRKCWTHERIAAELGVCRKTVTRNLATHNRRVLRRIEKQTAAIKARMLAQLEWMCEQAVVGWERSLEDAETIRTKAAPDNAAAPVLLESKDVTTKGQSGNPAFLREARGALADIRDILGLDKPSASDHPDARAALLFEAIEITRARQGPDEGTGGLP